MLEINTCIALIIHSASAIYLHGLSHAEHFGWVASRMERERVDCVRHLRNQYLYYSHYSFSKCHLAARPLTF